MYPLLFDFLFLNRSNLKVSLNINHFHINIKFELVYIHHYHLRAESYFDNLAETVDLFLSPNWSRSNYIYLALILKDLEN